MFEIGNSLREARARRKLSYDQVEAETKIRAKYIRCLEEEEFDALPSGTYVKGFLRTYADYLGLDGQLYVDEYNSRFGDQHHEDQLFRRRERPVPRRRQTNSGVMVALAGIVAVAVLFFVAWRFGGETPSTALQTSSRRSQTTSINPALPSRTAPASADRAQDAGEDRKPASRRSPSSSWSRRPRRTPGCVVQHGANGRPWRIHLRGRQVHRACHNASRLHHRPDVPHYRRHHVKVNGKPYHLTPARPLARDGHGPDLGRRPLSRDAVARPTAAVLVTGSEILLGLTRTGTPASWPAVSTRWGSSCGAC